MFPASIPRLPSRLAGALPAVLVLIGLLGGSSVQAQITPPAPGVELPRGYLDRIAEDRTAFQFRRAWIEESRRVQRNRALRDLGLLDRMDGIEALNATSGFRVEGTRRVPVLAGKFSNTPSDPYSPAQLQAQLFDGPNPTGTITDYYDEISYGYITLTGTVYGAQGGGLFQTAHPDTFYEGGAGCNGLCSSAETGEYLKELLDGADSWVDFGQFDNDGPDGIANSGDDDGYVDFVAFVHPEKGAECGGNDNIWSHRWVYEGWWGAPYATNDAAAGGGTIKVSDYTIQPLLACDGTSIIPIGVYTHEFGHAFGLPDLYDTDSANGTSAGVGQWCLMGSGSWGGDGGHPQTPAHMCAWAKEQLGWVEPRVVCAAEIGTPLAAVETGGEVLKVYPHGVVSAEYFLIENRVQTLFDTYLRTSGLAIWHVDNSVSGNADENHKLVDLEEADGLAQMDANLNRGDDGDLYPGSSNNQLFNDTTNPNAKDYLGANTGLVAGPFGAGTDPRSLDVAGSPCQLAVGDVVVDDTDWGNNSGALDGYERTDLGIGIRNDFAGNETGVTGILTSLTAGVVVLQDSVFYGTVSAGPLNYGDIPFELEATGALANGTAVQLQLDLAGDGGYASSHTVTIYAGSYVLLVEDDGAAVVNTVFQNAITNAGYSWVRHDTGTLGAPPLGKLRGALAVVWYTGDEYDATFSEAEQALVEDYLAEGGSIFVTGQDIGYDLVGEGNSADVAFYGNYLHANFVSDTSNDNTLTGVAGDPIGNGLSVTLTNLPSASFWPSVITAGAGASEVLRYSASMVGGIRYSTGHKVVYFPFNFEDINLTATQNTVMQRVLNWLLPSDVVPPTATLLSPNGGGPYEACGSVGITWTASDNVGVTGIDLYYSDDDGVSYPHVIATGLANTGSTSWHPDGLLGSGFRVKVVARDAVALQDVDWSDSGFAFQSSVLPAVTVLLPNGGETYAPSAEVPLAWTMLDTCVGVDSSRVYVSLDGGDNWSYVSTVLAPDTTAVWDAPGTAQDSCLVRVEVFSRGGASASDASDSLFTIAEASAAPPQMAGIRHPVLLQNFPNPAAAAGTRFAFYLPAEMAVSLRIYDLSGRAVRTVIAGTAAPGYHELAWNGTDDGGRAVSRGIYFYVLETPGKREARKLVKIN